MRSARAPAEIDAVTVDAFGTLVQLKDPVPGLREALRARGVTRDLDDVADAFRAEAAYYRPRSLRGNSSGALATLRRECVDVFLGHLGVNFPPADFVSSFVDSIAFRLMEGASEALGRLRAGGLALACVANWDIGLHEHLAHLEVAEHFAVVLTSADAGVEKPDPAIFEVALARLGVRADRAVHIGDESADRDGATAAGLAFEPVPLATLPERLRL